MRGGDKVSIEYRIEESVCKRSCSQRQLEEYPIDDLSRLTDKSAVGLVKDHENLFSDCDFEEPGALKRIKTNNSQAEAFIFHDEDGKLLEAINPSLLHPGILQSFSNDIAKEKDRGGSAKVKDLSSTFLTKEQEEVYISLVAPCALPESHLKIQVSLGVNFDLLTPTQRNEAMRADVLLQECVSNKERMEAVELKTRELVILFNTHLSEANLSMFKYKLLKYDKHIEDLFITKCEMNRRRNEYANLLYIYLAIQKGQKILTKTSSPDNLPIDRAQEMLEALKLYSHDFNAKLFEERGENCSKTCGRPMITYDGIPQKYCLMCFLSSFLNHFSLPVFVKEIRVGGEIPFKMSRMGYRDEMFEIQENVKCLVKGKACCDACLINEYGFWEKKRLCKKCFIHKKYFLYLNFKGRVKQVTNILQYMDKVLEVEICEFNHTEYLHEDAKQRILRMVLDGREAAIKKNPLKRELISAKYQKEIDRLKSIQVISLNSV